jgi:hypothetical protein
MSKSYDYLRGIYLGLPKTGVSIILYLTRPVITRTWIFLSHIAEYYSTALSVDIGEAGNNLYAVSQRLAIV